MNTLQKNIHTSGHAQLVAPVSIIGELNVMVKTPIAAITSGKPLVSVTANTFTRVAQTTTPTEISGSVRKFCAEISRERPFFVDFIDYGLRQSWCHLNVALLVEKYGGTYVPGWAIWTGPGVFDAEHHAVWRKQDGTFEDVTPRVDGEKQILFLPDPSRPFDFAAMRGWENKFRGKKDVSISAPERRLRIGGVDVSAINKFRAQIGLSPVDTVKDIPFPPC